MYPLPYYLLGGGIVKDKIAALVDSEIRELNVFVFDAFIDEEEGKKKINIVLDSEEIIDLNRITDASRIINKKLDDSDLIDDDIYEVDIYSREKGE